MRINMFVVVDFYSEESVNNQGLECLRFLNEVISDFDAVNTRLVTTRRGTRLGFLPLISVEFSAFFTPSFFRILRFFVCLFGQLNIAVAEQRFFKTNFGYVCGKKS